MERICLKCLLSRSSFTPFVPTTQRLCHVAIGTNDTSDTSDGRSFDINDRKVINHVTFTAASLRGALRFSLYSATDRRRTDNFGRVGRIIMRMIQGSTSSTSRYFVTTRRSRYCLSPPTTTLLASTGSSTQLANYRSSMLL